VQILGEGYNLGTLSVGALFRAYRHLAPYIQFVGRVLRLADPLSPHSPANKVYLVSHVGLNDERWWNEFTLFDKQDQQFFHEMMTGAQAVVDDEKGPRMTLRPFMRVLNEAITEYAVKGYLKQVDEGLIEQFKETVRKHGFDLAEFGLTDEALRSRLRMAGARVIVASPLPVQPQKRREQLRVRLSQDSRSAADTALNRLSLKHAGKDLLRFYPGKGPNNLIIMIALVNGWLNKQMNLESGEREQASLEQLEIGISKVPDAVDAITNLVGTAIKDRKARGKV